MKAEQKLVRTKKLCRKTSFHKFCFLFKKERRVDNDEIQKFISKKADLAFFRKSDAPTTVVR